MLVRRTPSVSAIASRVGASALPVTAALACFGFVIAALYYTANSDTENAEAANRSPRTVTDRVPGTSAEAVTGTEKPNANEVKQTVAAEHAVVEREENGVGSGDSSSAATVRNDDSVAGRLERVKAHLEFGEFGPAIDVARSATDAKERTQLLSAVADAQLKSGEFGAALSAIRQMPIAENRIRARGERATQMALSGGAQVDPQPLMDLILNETTGPWEEIDGDGGTMDFFQTGVIVHPNGLLGRLTQEEHSGRLNDFGFSARAADLNDDMAAPSELRIVSLTRLEREIARRLANGEPVVETMKHLAGLSQVRYVLVYPEENEIVIAGPAESWQFNENGIPVGVESGKPTLQLDDLVTVLRTFADGGMKEFGCSINPRQEGLKRLRAFVEQSNARGPLSAGAQVRRWVNTLQEKLGLQDIVIYGVPHNSRAARVIVEADYRMKLIGVDRLNGGSGIPCIFDLLTVEEQKSSKLDALRWWLSMKYDAVLHSEDHNVFEIQGASVLCQSTNQLITSQGKQIDTGKADSTNQLFAKNFTDHYAELAKRDSVFADMQNIFDLALVSALLKHERLGDRIGWDLGVFAKDGAYRPAEYEAPMVIESVVNHRVYRGKDIVVQVAGGVRADVRSFVKAAKLGKRLDYLSDKGRAGKLPEGRWWWDAQNKK